MLVAKVDPYFRTESSYSSFDYVRGSQRTLNKIDHPEQIQCIHCAKNIDRVGFNGAIGGFYYKQYHAYVHYICYDEIEQELALKMYEKEASICKDVEKAIDEDDTMAYIHYDMMRQPVQDDPTETKTYFKYCSYCSGRLDTSTKQGVSYPSSNEAQRDMFGRQYIHTDCYNFIAMKKRGLIK